MTEEAGPAQHEELMHVGQRYLRVVVTHGDSSRTPLLLLNGIGAPLELLQPLVDALAGSREIIRVDVPGVGGSPVPVFPYSMGTLCLSLANLLTKLGHREPVDVLGFSWGGALAQHFALQHRHRVRRLVLAATGPGVLSVPGHPRVLARMSTPRRHRDPEYARKIAADMYGGAARDNPDAAISHLRPTSRTRSVRGYYYQLAAGSIWSSLGWLRLVRPRTLILAGNDDPIIPVINARLMARLIPRATLHVYDGGHLDLLTVTKTLLPTLVDFLDGRGSRREASNPVAAHPRM